MAKNEVPRDNLRTLTIGSETFELEASLGAGITYANEFRGKVQAPYNGSLSNDMLTVWRRNQRTLGMDGEKVDNDDYSGIDVEALLRIAWAMAVAAGSTKDGYERFVERIIHQPAGVFEEASLYDVVVLELGGGIIFRQPEGQGGAEQADA